MVLDIWLIKVGIKYLFVKKKLRPQLKDPNDLAIVQSMLLDPAEEIENNGDETDTDSEDRVEEREEDSESEQDVSSSSEEDEVVEDDFYLGNN
ncbi:unnamed protein product [Euphydryas editha]|uniref:Uncharacterized protein n=1 Tax=Euphydryas editha TaxID=104508 RepID=A0AAU9UW87_EUPED|nr:unnamed protein product [Euphydryas editha]